MFNKRLVCSMVIVLVLSFVFADTAEARRRGKRRRRYSGPPPTHPVILWSRTLSESQDREQRKVAAFKLSQYSQPIFQDSVVNVLFKCMKDPDVQIKVLCTKAMGRAGTQSHTESIRSALLEQFSSDATVKNTVVRAFIARKDISPKVQNTFMESAKKTGEIEDLLVLLSYFEKFGNGSNEFVDSLVSIYGKHENIKSKRAVVKVLADRAEGQDSVVELMASCSQSKDTPLALNCLDGLQRQGKKDTRAWTAVEKTMASEDPDVLMASLDVINALPDTSNPKISARLVTLVKEVEDAELQEKAVLALGVCGDRSENTVRVLLGMLDDKDVDEGVRIASALILGKQAAAFPGKAKELLSQCSKSGSTQSLRTACQLGLQELDIRAKTIVKSPSSEEAGAASEPPAAAAASKSERSPQSEEEPVEGETTEEAEAAVAEMAPEAEPAN